MPGRAGGWQVPRWLRPAGLGRSVKPGRVNGLGDKYFYHIAFLFAFGRVGLQFTLSSILPDFKRIFQYVRAHKAISVC